MCILDSNCPSLDSEHAPRRVSELEHVSRHALDGEVLVHGADEGSLGLQQDSIVRRFRNGTARSQGQHPGTAPAAKSLIYSVIVNQRSATPAPGGESLGDHLDDLVELLASKLTVGIGATHQFEEITGGPVLRCRFRHDLLGENIRWVFDDPEPIQDSGTGPAQEGGTLNQIVATQREKPSLRRAGHRVSAPTNPLQEGRNPMR